MKIEKGMYVLLKQVCKGQMLMGPMVNLQGKVIKVDSVRERFPAVISITSMHNGKAWVWNKSSIEKVMTREENPEYYI